MKSATIKFTKTVEVAMEPKIFIDLFYNMLKEFCPHFRADVAPTFLVLALAWVGTTRAQRTSNFIRTIGPEHSRHTATYYRFFACSQWCLDWLGLSLLYMTCALLGSHPVLHIVVDDTLLKHRGPQIFGASIFRDAVLSTRSYVVKRWGLNWVVLSLALPHPYYFGEFICIPLATRLFLTEEWCKKAEQTYASPSEMTVQMVLFFYCHGPNVQWRLAGDGGYTNGYLLGLELERLTFTGTLRYDANIEMPLEGREYAGRGRHPIYGLPYPKPHQIVTQKKWRRTKVTFTSYQGKVLTRTVIELEGTYKQTAGTRRLRFVFILAQEEGEKNCYLVTTDLYSPLNVIVEDFVSRWCTEVVFREAKQLMGVEKSQVWAQDSVKRMAGFGFWLMGVVKVWFLRYKNHLPDVSLSTDWYEPREVPSFGKMLSVLRYSLYHTLLSPNAHEEEIFQLFGLPQNPVKRQDLILRLFCGC